MNYMSDGVVRKRLLFLVLLVGVSGLSVQWANCEELIVGVSETDYTPFYFETKDGVFEGAAAEIAHHLANQLGHTLTFKRFPWKRVQHNLATGAIDMVCLYFKTDERAQHVHYVDEPHIYESSSLVVVKDSTIQFDGNLEKLSNYQFGNVSGYWHGKGYSENAKLTKQEFSSTRALLGSLIRKTVDIAVGNKPVMTGITNEMGITHKVRFLDPKIDYAPDYIAFSKAKPNSERLARDFSVVFKEFKQTPLYREILNRYGFELPTD